MEKAAQIEKEVKVISMARVVKLGLEQIIPNPDQPREYFDQQRLALLAETIKARGDVVEPVRVTPQGGNGVFMIVNGERRWRAAKIAGVAAISCLIEGDLSKDEMFELSALLNFCQEQMTYLEKAKAFHRIMTQHSFNQTQLSKLLGVHQVEICNYLKMLNLIPEIQQLLKERKIGNAIALNISNFKAEHQAEILAAFNELVQKRGRPFNASETSRLIKQIAEKRRFALRTAKYSSKVLSSSEMVGHAFERAMNAFTTELSKLCDLDKGQLCKLKNPSARLILEFIENLQKRLAMAENEIQEKL